ncbi:MAG: Nudix family hydrolase [Moraxellaceae bacterium]|nr:Nudix family hydrolase [Moraxellaceae bacterium]
MKRILVVAAVIRREGKILIAKRPAHLHMGGLWEFPGGKVEAAEPVEAALLRELEEELGIAPTAFRPLIRIAHDYPDKSVCLDVWDVTAFRGEPQGLEGQPLAWVRPDELALHEFPAANRPIVTAARLPARYLITPDMISAAERQHWLEQRLARGAQLVLFRAPHLPRDAYLAEASDLLRTCRAAGAALMLHGAVELLQDVAADGVHLPARHLRAESVAGLPPGSWLAASVHDEHELALATSLGADFVTLSPVATTSSHPGMAGMGWSSFAHLVRAAVLPVYALGGMTDTDVDRAREHGAQGVAGITGLFAETGDQS